ncbi:MAG: DVU_1556 family methyltransferase [Syntrophobacteraceae bacterium]
MAFNPSHTVFERFATHGLTDGPVRPGGLELTEHALSLCDFPYGSRLLDVGCGTGVTLDHLRAGGFFAAGIDPSSVMLGKAQVRNPSLPLLRASAEQLPFRDSQWDGILAECSLSLAKSPIRALGECRRVLKRGGRIIVHDVYVRNPEAIPELRALSLGSCVTGAMSREEMLGALDTCGLAVLLWEDRTLALKRFLAELIFAHGSADCLWSSIAECSPQDGGRIASILSRAKLGYFLAIATPV